MNILGLISQLIGIKTLRLTNMFLTKQLNQEDGRNNNNNEKGKKNKKENKIKV